MITLKKIDLPQSVAGSAERWLVRFKTPTRAERRADVALRNCAYAQTRAHLRALSSLVRPDGSCAAQTCIPTWRNQ